MTRPAHLQTRPISTTYAEDAVLITTAGGSRGDDGRFVKGAETRTAVKCATAPDERRTSLGLEGAAVVNRRRFWLKNSSLEPIAVPLGEDKDNDRIEYAGEIYRIASVMRWDGFIEATAYQLLADGESAP